MKTALRPEKFDECSGNIVNTEKKCNFQVHSTSLPGSHCITHSHLFFTTKERINNVMLSWWELNWRSKNAVRTKCNSFPSAPCLYYVSEVHTRFMLRCYYVKTIVSMSLLSSHCILILIPHYDFLTCSKFNHVLHVHKDHIKFSSVSSTLVIHCKSSYCIRPIFSGHSGNLA